MISGKLRRSLHDALAALATGGAAGLYHPGARWYGSHPFNEAAGPEAIAAIWATIRISLPDLERRDAIFVGGRSVEDARGRVKLEGRQIVAAMGHLQGTFRRDLVGIPATGGTIHLRYGEIHVVEAERIAESYVLWDLLDLMRQAGVWPIAPSLGSEGMWPGPATGDGLRLDETPQANGTGSIETVLAMHASLNAFDGRSLDSMPMTESWTPNFMWYGPAGIGTTRGLAGFRAHHQIPFLIGFPDRKGSSHVARIGDGAYAVTGGWPSVVGTHLGEWLGLPPTKRVINMRVMDFYRLEGGFIAENWVPIDVIDILRQMGFDVFGRLRHLRGEHPVDLPWAGGRSVAETALAADLERMGGIG